MTFIDKNSSSHTAQSVTLYLQKQGEPNSGGATRPHIYFSPSG